MPPGMTSPLVDCRLGSCVSHLRSKGGAPDVMHVLFSVNRSAGTVDVHPPEPPAPHPSVDCASES